MAPERDRHALCNFLSDAFAADHNKFKPSLFEKACNLPFVVECDHGLPVVDGNESTTYL